MSTLSKTKTKSKTKYKIILTGSSSVGKTSLCHNISGDTFNNKIPVTIGVDFMKIEIEDSDNTFGQSKQKTYEIYVWDTAGHENFRSITKSYYRNSQIILLCFDLTDRKSFNELDIWITEIKSIITEPVYICLLGLKTDLEPIISDKEIDSFLKKHIITTFYRFSSKESKSADKIKRILLSLIHKYNLMIEDYAYCQELKNGTFDLDSGCENLEEVKDTSGRNCC